MTQDLTATKTKTFPPTMSMGLINVRSVNNKTIEFQEMIASYSLDMIVVTETWLNGDDKVVLGNMCPDNFTVHHNPRKSGIGGGLAFLHRNNIKVSPLQSPTYRTMETMMLSINTQAHNYHVVIVYRPPPSAKNKLTVPMFKEDLSSLLKSCAVVSNKLIILGDFNVHVNDSNDNLAAFFLDSLSSFGLTQHVTAATSKLGHTIDLVITRKNDKLLSLDVFEPLISDHKLVNFTIPTAVTKICEKKKITFRKFDKIDCNKLCTHLENSELYTTDSNDVNFLADLYDCTISKIIDDLAPLQTKVVVDRVTAPWFTNEIANSRRLRRKMERKWRRTHCAVDFEAYKQAKNQVVRLVFLAKSSFFTNEIENSSGNQKELFKIINNLMHKKKVKKLPDVDTKLLPEQFNDFFYSKIDKIQNHLQSQQTGDDAHAYDQQADTTFTSFQTVSKEEVEKIVLARPNKQCSLDPIPTWIIKKCIQTITPILTKIINCSINGGTVPNVFKRSVITPLLKKDNLDSNDLKNYRPVSGLSFISKVLEKVVSNQLNSYKNTFHLREPMQSAYRQHHSTETAMLKIINDLLMAADRGECSLLVLLDLSAAFDTVNHTILLSRLQNRFGICGTALEWMASYLHERKQQVVIDGIYSSEATLKLNVPQGSILGPDEYSDFTEPIGAIIRQHAITPHFYADDSQLYTHFQPDSSDSRQCAVLKIEKCCADVKEWMTSNYLKLNDNKTEVVKFGTKKQLSKTDSLTSVNIGNSVINISPSAKNIGVLLDSELKMIKHINYISSSAWLHLKNIYRIRIYLTPEATTCLVHAFVTSKIDLYNCLLYGVSQCAIQKLQKVMNAAAKLILGGKKFDSVTPLLKKLHWLPVKQRINYKILLITYKALHGLAPSYLKDLLKPYRPNRNLRSNDQLLLQIPRTNKSYGDRAFEICAPKLWNDLPLFIRESNSLVIFKKLLKTYLFNVAFDKF